MELKRIGRIFVRLLGAIVIVSITLIAGLTLQQHKAACACDNNIIINALNGGSYYADISSAVHDIPLGADVSAQGTYIYSNYRTGTQEGSGTWSAPSLITLPLPPQGQQIIYDYQCTRTIYIDGNPLECAYGFIDIGS